MFHPGLRRISHVQQILGDGILILDWTLSQSVNLVPISGLSPSGNKDWICRFGPTEQTFSSEDEKKESSFRKVVSRKNYND